MKPQNESDGRTDLAREHHPVDSLDDDGKLIETPDTFADYAEFAGDNDATPDDRRLDPLRKS
jgi:hypothetical protein